MDRTSWLRQGLPLDSPGIEIGPLARPIIRRPGSAIRYADHLDREGLRAKYAAHSPIDIDAIPDIDYVIGAEGLGVAVGDAKFHYVVASHVIEHVPNPIAWMRDVQGLLVDGGNLVLAVPDMRRCFDALRRPSTAGEWVGAYLEGHSRPSASRIFDALSNEVKVDGRISWATDPDELEMIRSRSPQAAFEIARHYQTRGEYFDVHCWTFTPATFFNLMRTVVSAGLLSMHLVAHRDTQGDEFMVKLAYDPRLPRTSMVASFPAAGGRFDRLPERFDATQYYRRNPDVLAAGVDPYEHYLEHGWREGRRFS